MSGALIPLISTIMSGTVFSRFWIEVYDFSLPGY